jgi:hypothetical protein
MNVRELTLSTATTAVLLGDISTTSEGHAIGYTIDKLNMSPAPRNPRKQETPLAGGGIVTPGRRGIRLVEVEGRIVAPTAQEVNELRRGLVDVCNDFGDDAYITVAFTPEDDELELTGTLDGQLDFETVHATTDRYRFTLACPDPLAYSTTVKTGTATASPGTTLTVDGDSEVWPEFTGTFSGQVDALRIGNSTTGRFIRLEDLESTDGQELRIVTRPGYEEVTLDGVSIMDKRDLSLSRWVSFVPGANGFYRTIGTGGGTITVTATWRDGWAA